MGVERGASCLVVLFVGKKLFQFFIFLCPLRFLLVKGIRKAAPSDILGKNLLFLSRGIPVLSLQLFHKADCFHIGSVSGLVTLRKVKTFTNDKVAALRLFGRLLLNLFIHDLTERRRFGLGLFFGQVIISS